MGSIMKSIKGARGVATFAALGNLLQGWDGGAIAGALLYLKPEFNLEATPALEGFVVASTLIGAVASVAIAGPSADWLGRKTMLAISGVLYSVAALVMSWAPTVYILIVGRILVGSAIGLAATIAPILISESAPAEIRGQLATLPQLMGSGGLFLAYVMDFVLSLQPTVNWRFMLGILLAPSLIYVGLAAFLLPESPRWLVSKGRMLEARTVLQGLRDQEDVSAEMALLVEGLGVGGETQLEEWLLKPVDKPDKDDDEESVIEEGQIKLFGPDESTWVATPITDESGSHALLSRRPSLDGNATRLIDPVVTMLGSFQAAFEFTLSSHDVAYDDEKTEHWDEEGQTPHYGDNGYHSETDLGIHGDLDENLGRPLLSDNKYGSGANLPPISRNNSSQGQGYIRSNSKSEQQGPISRQGSSRRRFSHSNSKEFAFSGRYSMSNSKSMAQEGGVPESLGGVGIGGGWQLAYRWEEGSKDGDEGGLKRVFLKGEGGELSRFQSNMTLPGVGPQHSDMESIQAAVLVGQSAHLGKELLEENLVGPAIVHPAETATQGPLWSNLAELGVQRALIVGIGLQVLQQFSGINAVLYFTPQILMQSGAGDLLANIGIDGESASIMASGVTCLLMLPCIVLAMWLMDRSGRRQLLLATIPVLAISLVALVLVNMFLTTGIIPAAVSFTCVTIFTCSFVAGFGPIPNILCSEIFPTRVRGVCIGICAAAMWTSNVVVTYSFPLINQQFGLQGVFGMFAVVSVIAWIFVFLKVPETKGLPLEIISEFFAMAPKKDKDTHDDY